MNNRLGNRRQGSAFPDRKRIALRLPAPLYLRLSATCNASAMTTTAMVSVILETAVLAPLSDTARHHFETAAVDRDPDRVTLSIRLLPSLFAAVKARAMTCGVSLNSFVIYYVELALGDPAGFAAARSYVINPPPATGRP